MRPVQPLSQLATIKRFVAAFVLMAVSFWPGVLPAETVAVRYTEGALHGFLVLRTLEDRLLADGDLIQTVVGDRVTTRLLFRFTDGSIHEETTVYSQHQRFQLISNRLVQKGPAFPRPLEMSIDGATGSVTVNYEDERGELRREAAHFDLPADLANGIVSKLLVNTSPDEMPMTISMIAATPKPRLVKLAITTAGQERLSIGGSSRRATSYVLKVETGIVAGLLAPLLGRQPPDSRVWILEDDLPAFVRAEQTLFVGGPIWRIELASPVWPITPTSASAKADTIGQGAFRMEQTIGLTDGRATAWRGGP